MISGHCTGVQQRIKEVAPQATYVHCYAHCLNLVLVDSTRSVSHAADFFCSYGNSLCFYQQVKHMQSFYRSNLNNTQTSKFASSNVFPIHAGPVGIWLLMLCVVLLIQLLQLWKLLLMAIAEQRPLKLLAFYCRYKLSNF